MPKNTTEETTSRPLNNGDKWGLEWREYPVRDGYDWLRYQAGRVVHEIRIPNKPAEPVFELLGYGRTWFDAEEMAEKRIGKDERRTCKT